MYAEEFLTEVAVLSSWIKEIKYNRKKRQLLLILGNNNRYTIDGISRTIFDKWKTSPSKGKYFHQIIAGKYKANRI
jgi:hypothetical protein